ncbi:hypothetical protein ACQUW0_26790, partial [Ralstonia pseudosolanacearum]|uniref:hypothetical protein n=1 Tax=Ralstonia pseudosolanacearum TaxID=1310165 RepID=UPI003D170FCD
KCSHDRQPRESIVTFFPNGHGPVMVVNTLVGISITLFQYSAIIARTGIAFPVVPKPTTQTFVIQLAHFKTIPIVQQSVGVGRPYIRHNGRNNLFCTCISPDVVCCKNNHRTVPNRFFPTIVLTLTFSLTLS